MQYALDAKLQNILNINQASEVMHAYLDDIKLSIEKISSLPLTQQEIVLFNVLQDAVDNVINAVHNGIELTKKIDLLVCKKIKIQRILMFYWRENYIQFLINMIKIKRKIF